MEINSQKDTSVSFGSQGRHLFEAQGVADSGGRAALHGDEVAVGDAELLAGDVHHGEQAAVRRVGDARLHFLQNAFFI